VGWAAPVRREKDLIATIGRYLAMCFALASALLIALPVAAQMAPEAKKAFTQGTDAMHSGALEEAAGDFLKVTTLEPSFAPAYFNLGLVRLLQKQPGEAIAALEKSLRLQPRERGAHLFLGIAYYRKNEYAKAQTALQKEVRLDPENATALMWLGVVQLAQGDALAACVTLDQAAELKPNDVDILYHRGRAHMLVSKDSYEQMFHADPSSWRVHQVLAQSYLEADRYDDAIAEFQLAIQEHPEEPGLHEELGDAYWKHVQLPQAEDAFREELKIDPDNSSAIYKLAVVSLEHSEPTESKKLLTQVIAMEPHFADAEYQLGRADAQLGDLDAAIGDLQAAVADCGEKDRETLRQAYYQLAQVYRRAQRPEESTQALNEFLRLKKQADADQAQKLAEKLKNSGDEQEKNKR
jgi:tetratricopeptide (TPR) repeat protein